MGAPRFLPVISWCRKYHADQYCSLPKCNNYTLELQLKSLAGKKTINAGGKGEQKEKKREASSLLQFHLPHPLS